MLPIPGSEDTASPDAVADLPSPSPESRGQAARFSRALRRRAIAVGPWAPLALILAIGLALRLYGLNWDDGQHLHPDERQITFVVTKLDFPWPPDGALLLDPQASPLNPHFFSYGSLPLYLLAAVGAIVSRLGWLLNILVGHGPIPSLSTWQQAGAYGQINLLGRALSALFDTGTAALLYFLGRSLYGRNAGLIAAAGYAVTALAVQQAHFYVVDPVLTFFVVLTVAMSYRAAERGSLRLSATLGLIYGAAVATKVSAAPLALVVLLAHITTFDPSTKKLRWLKPEEWAATLPGLVVAGVVSAIVFVIFNPYSVLDTQEFLRDIGAQSAMVRGLADFPYTRQYTHTAPYLYWLRELVTWQLTPLLGVLACAGAVFAIVRTFGHREAAEPLYIAWLLPYFLLTGAFFSKYPRYMLPAVPFMLVALAGLVTWSSARWKVRQIPYWIASVAILVGLVYSIAYDHVYQAVNTRVAASTWMYEHIPVGSTVVGEHWDDLLPLGLPQAPSGRNPGDYKLVELPIYDPDSAAKELLMSGILARGQYVVLSSDIVRGSVLRVPERYPLMRQYYRALAGGKLGYQATNTFESYPTIFGIIFRDDGADLNWSYYDHPRVEIYENVGHFTPTQIQAAMGQAPAAPVVVPAKETPPEARLQVSPSDLAANLLGPVYTSIFPTNSVGMRLPVFIWLFNLELLGLVSLPIAALVCRGLTDAGACVAKTLGWLLFTFGTWWLASAHLFAFSKASMTLTAVVLFVLGVLLFMRLPDVRGTLLRGWRFGLVGEALFLVAFVAFLLIRMANPDTWHLYRGGERPMEFAYVNGILRSAYFPPFDTWLSGTYNNYYYFGLAMLAVLFRWTAIVPTTGWNLADPTLFALTAQAVFGIALTIAVRLRSDFRGPLLASNDFPGREPPRLRLSQVNGTTIQAYARRAGSSTRQWILQERGPLTAGVASSLLAVVFGNVASGPWLIENLRKAGESASLSSTPLLSGLAQVIAGIGVTIATRGTQFPQFDFFGLTRVIPFTINEFPFFSFLYGDLHPHVIDYTLTTLALAVLASIAVGGGGDLVPMTRIRSSRLPGFNMNLTSPLVATFFVAALMIGVLGPSNIWDLPIYVAFTPLAVACWQWRGEGRPFWRACLEGLAWGIAVFALGRLLFRPFYSHFVALSGGLGLPIHHTPLGPFLEVYGLLFFVAASFALAQFGTWDVNSLVLMAPGAILAALTKSIPIFLLTSCILLLVGSVSRRRLSTARLLLTMIFVTAATLVLGTELVYVRDPLQGGDMQRMNSVFKFGVQAWLLFSVGGGPALYALSSRDRYLAPRRREGRVLSPTSSMGELVTISGGEDVTIDPAELTSVGRESATAVENPESPSPHPPRDEIPDSHPEAWEKSLIEQIPWRLIGAKLWTATLAIFLCTAAVYPVAATAVKVRDRFNASAPCGTAGQTCEGTPVDQSVAAAYTRPGLDGLLYMKLAYPGDYAAVQWLQSHVRGNKVIAEAFKDIYAWDSRVSWNTGLPTLLGWDNQERQFHAPETIDARRTVLDTIYNSHDPQLVLGLLHQYHVSYVYVGAVERATYDPLGVAKFGALVGQGVERVYDDQGVAMYHVTGEP